MIETGYLAPEGFERQLAEELDEISVRHGRLFLAPGPARRPAWAQNIWYKPQRLTIRSIADGARQLRDVQRNWALYDFQLHRRARLIQDRLPHVSSKPLRFPSTPPTAPLGSWTLLDERTILASPHCSSPFRHGEVEFVEDRKGPPNRAYLKLWEVFTLLGEHPRSGERCLDLGASPGGWTWVLACLGAQVVSVDKAPLDATVASYANVEHRAMSAFALEPREIGPVDWLFSDIACYPRRLLRLVETWLASELVGRFVCTIKFQGETDHATARAFAAIPGSRLFHLHHNKHELTWIKM
ncbi:MAG TPA: SAM-dependent methyltransferase [Alphaproteobacteria bacterium]|nr:SAM-dependent methyltransferase [Alphaproteobacteria bacterium]